MWMGMAMKLGWRCLIGSLFECRYPGLFVLVLIVRLFLCVCFLNVLADFESGHNNSSMHFRGAVCLNK